MKREEYLRMINFGALLSNTSNFLYTYILIALLIFAGLYFTVRTRGVQFRLFPEALRVLGEKKKDGKDISSFQALMISTASRVGTGNIAGVANAIIAATVIGGYGAVFWMWLLALIGAASAFIESTLAQCYKEKHGDNWVGGPAYYIQKALGSRFFGVVFAVLLIACFAYGFNALQAYNAGSALQYYLPGYSESVWAAGGGGRPAPPPPAATLTNLGLTPGASGPRWWGRRWPCLPACASSAAYAASAPSPPASSRSWRPSISPWASSSPSRTSARCPICSP